MIPTCEPSITPADVAAVTQALEAGHASIGPEVEAFEAAVAKATGIPHAVATSSGSAALIVACQAVFLPHETVTLPTLTFAAAAEAILHAGLRLEFMDHGQGGMLGTNFYGHPPASMPAVYDCAEGLGSSPMSGLGDPQATCLSFNGNKIITAGQGGMILTKDAGLAARCRALIAHERTERVAWTHAGVGWNFRMPAMNAALGLSQMARLEAHVASKRETAFYYGSRCPAGTTLHPEPAGARSNWWMPLLLLDRPAAPVIESLLAHGVGARPVWTPLHRVPAYRGFRAERTAVADDLWRRGLLLPCSVGITPQEREAVLAGLRRAL